jgi:lysophospholipase L1-like esterase
MGLKHGSEERRATAPGRAKSGPGWGVGLLLAAGATSAAIGAAEIGLRAFHLTPEPGLFTVTERQFRQIPGIFGPDQLVHLQAGTRFAHVVTINSLGYRGADFPRARPDGEFRVLFAGDSFTFGHNVQDDETLPAQLEQRLRMTCGPATVVNAGLSGSTILTQEQMVLRGLAVDPNLVIVMFHENDIDELIHLRMWEQLERNRKVKSRFPVSVVYPLLRGTATWNLALHVRRTRAQPADQEAAQYVDTPAHVRTAALLEYRNHLQAVSAALAAKGIPFILAAFPHPESVAARRGGEDYVWVLETAVDIGIPTIDLLQPVLESGVPMEEAYLVPEDYHPSPAGHAIAADFIAASILRRARSSCGSLETNIPALVP